MPRRTIDEMFVSTNCLKILAFLAANPGREFLSGEIQKATQISRAGVYLALRRLTETEFAHRIERGRFHLYSVIHDHPAIRFFKILLSIVDLERSLGVLRQRAERVVLFGSVGRGEDDASSDIDVLIIAKDPEKTKALLPSFINEHKLQAVILTPSEWPDFREKEPIFAAEIERGIILWESRDEPGIRGMPKKGQNQEILKREDSRSQRTGHGRVRFKPGPKNTSRRGS